MGRPATIGTTPSRRPAGNERVGRTWGRCGPREHDSLPVDLPPAARGGQNRTIVKDVYQGARSAVSDIIEGTAIREDADMSGTNGSGAKTPRLMLAERLARRQEMARSGDVEGLWEIL